MLNNYPRWYTFTPPQWHVFPPPLTPLGMLAAGPAPAGDCGRFCYHTDLQVALITCEGAANAQLVAVKGAIVALMRRLRQPTCSYPRNTFSEILLHISGRLSGLRRVLSYGEVGRMQHFHINCCTDKSPNMSLAVEWPQRSVTA